MVTLEANSSSLSSSLLLVMSMDDTDARSSSALGSRLVANIPGIARRATPQSRIARGTKTPEVAAKENALRDLLIGVDGSLRGGTIRKVLVHVAFILENVDLIDCFLHGFRRYCSASALLGELSRAFLERMDMSLAPPEVVKGALYAFLWEWVELYFEQDFKSAPLRAKLIRLIEQLDLEPRNKLKLLILRQARGLIKVSQSLSFSFLPPHADLSVQRAGIAYSISAPLLSPNTTSTPPPVAAKESQEMISWVDAMRETKSAAEVSWLDVMRETVSLPLVPPSVITRCLTVKGKGQRAGKGEGSHPDIRSVTLVADHPPPGSILFHFKTDDIAKQLTLLEFQMYESVQASEFQDNAWQAPDKHIRAPFLTAMVRFSNKVTAWIEHEVGSLQQQGCNRQTDALEFAIRLAGRCHELRNYNTLMEIFSALSMASVSCFKEAWARVDPKLRATFDALEDLLTPVGNFRKYREELRAASQLDVPVLPYIGTFLRDVLFANDGNPHNLNGSEQHINWDKIQIIGNQINNFNRFKKQRFQFPLHLQLRELLVTLPDAYGESQ